MDFNDAKNDFVNGFTATDGDTAEADETPTAEEAAAEGAQQRQLAADEAAQQQPAAVPQQTDRYTAAEMQIAQLQQQMGAIMEQNRQFQEQNRQLQALISQQNDVQEQAIAEDMQQKPVPPTLDWDELTFEDESTRRQKLLEYQNARDEYLKAELMRELSPTLEYAKQAQAEAAMGAAIAQLKQDPKFGDIEQLMPRIRHVMSTAPELFNGSDKTVDLLNGYLIAKGIASVETPPPQAKTYTPQELVDAVLANPEAAALMEKKRIAALANNQSVPAMSASSGAGNAALNNQNRPNSFKDSKGLLSRLFGIN